MSRIVKEALLFAAVVVLVAVSVALHELAIFLMDSDGMIFNPVYPAIVAAGPVVGALLGSALSLAVRGERA